MMVHRTMEESEFNEFAFWANETAKHALIKCSSGNLSHRVQNNQMLISASGCWLSELTAKQIAIFNIDNGTLINDIKPSAEHKFHLGIMQSRKEINTVLHFQSQAATTIACMGIEPDYNVIIEIPIYIGKICHLPYFTPGSHQLAEAVIDKMRECSLVQLSNHGQVVCGKSYQDVIQKAVFFELACNILLQSNFSAKALNNVQVESLLTYTLK